MKLNHASIDLIKRFEGCRLVAYRDPVGIWTIGYGHTNDGGYPEIKQGTKITKVEAEALLVRDLERFEELVAKTVKVRLTPNQFGALVSFCCNVGAAAFRRSSVLDRVNRMRFSEVPSRLALWNRAGGRVLPGLVKRRAGEGQLFLA